MLATLEAAESRFLTEDESCADAVWNLATTKYKIN
jgi:hypothetical protein